jgi:hypothetical protein
MDTERIENLLKSNKLSDWEQDFCASINSQLIRGRKLSAKQVNLVHKIEGKVAKLVVGYDQWIKQWDDEKRKVWNIAIDYYEKNRPYFSNEVAKRKDARREEREYIPPQRTFKKVVENKYVQKVINELDKKPAFEPGSMVTLRASVRPADLPDSRILYREIKELKATPLFVMAVLDSVGSSAKGAREYSILPAGWTRTLKVQERHIKKAK